MPAIRLATRSCKSNRACGSADRDFQLDVPGFEPEARSISSDCWVALFSQSVFLIKFRIHGFALLALGNPATWCSRGIDAFATNQVPL